MGFYISLYDLQILALAVEAVRPAALLVLSVAVGADLQTILLLPRPGG